MNYNFRNNKNKMITFRITEEEETKIIKASEIEEVEKTEAARALLAGALEDYFSGPETKAKSNNTILREEKERVVNIIKKEKEIERFGENNDWDDGFLTALDIIIAKIIK